jgi:coenzyme F420-reducing hydrogenase beta subunit
MKPDTEGFPYPSIDSNLCNKCSQCYSFCPALNSTKAHKTDDAVKVYAAWSLDNEVRYDSTSGGIFTELAKQVIEGGGCAAGVKYNAGHLAEHVLIYKTDDIYLLRQSKYIQSETKDIFIKVKAELRKGRQVLFSGTPCQCAGMRHYLQAEYKNLILCDFICRGVNSPSVYLKYLQELESNYNAKIKQVWFKNKTNGWNNFGTKIIFDDGREYFASRDEDPFMYGYIKKGLNLYMRPSCGICKFKGVERPVDITLGDFWGMKTKPDYGVSMVMIHSVRGGDCFEKIRPRIYSEERCINDVPAYNKCLTDSSVPNGMRNNFWESFYHNGFLNSLKNYI